MLVNALFSRWFSLFVFVALGSLTLGSLAMLRPAVGQEAALQPRHWRVVWTAAPATSARVLWNTTAAGKDHRLHWRPVGSDAAPATTAAVSERFQGGDEVLYTHGVSLTGLQPSTAYELRMESDGRASRWFFFLTAPADDRPLAMIHGGDSRSDSAMRRKMNGMIADLVHDSFANDDPGDDIVAFAHGGDYIVNGRSLPQWKQWMDDHEETTGEDGRLIPVIPARGNHDQGPIFNQVFGFPAEDENYYAVNLGSALRFVTLNSEISTAGDQARWLHQELAEARPDHRWLLVQYHRPVFPAVKSPGAGLLSWVPLFERYHVDLVCESDGHVVKRTVPIRDRKPDPSGVVYIGEGGLGVPQRTPKKERWFLQEPGMADAAHHVFVITAGADVMKIRCETLTRGVIDRSRRRVRPAKVRKGS